MSSTPYNSSFYEHVNDTSRSSAEIVLPLVLSWIRPSSIIDFGCGLGAWLQVAKQYGISDYIGIDGSYIDRSKLLISSDNFVEADLTQPIDLGRRFDLAICLEVGEHLPRNSAENLVNAITKHSDIVLFAAAIPYQGGTFHINEQWPKYWADLFFQHNFRCYDCLRYRIWDDDRIAWWFRQNMLVYARNLSPQWDFLAPYVVNNPMSLVHPLKFESTSQSLSSIIHLENVPSLSWLYKALLKSIKLSVLYRLNALNR